MAGVLARLGVDRDGRITGRVEAAVPAGEYTVELPVPGPPEGPLPADGMVPGEDELGWQVDDEPWPAAGASLRREGLYGDDGP